MERKIYNPVQKDAVTFLKTHTDTNGECTLIEVELADEGGVGLHYHKTYSEKFECLDGEVDKKGFPKNKLTLAWLFDIS